jgi:ATP adenylyltransferase
MERLWAPWRMAYVEVKEPAGCIFCEKPKAGDDRQELILYRGQTAFVLLNKFPYNNGHLMVAPYRHTADLAGLSAEEQAEIIGLGGAATRLLEHALSPDGFNLGINLGRTAGAGVAEHLHLHVVPRWNGDTNFMPVLAETKVLPDALFSSYDRLRQAVEETQAFGVQVFRCSGSGPPTSQSEHLNT